MCVSDMLLHTNHLLVYIANCFGDSLTAKLHCVVSQNIIIFPYEYNTSYHCIAATRFSRK